MSGDPTFMTGAKTIVRGGGVTVAAVSAVIAFCSSLLLAHRVPGIDFYQFWVVGTELRYESAGAYAANVYSDAQRTKLGQKWLAKAQRSGPRQLAAARVRPKLETFSSPFLYSVFAALSTDNYDRDHQRYGLLCLVASTAAVVVLCRLFAYTWLRTLLAVTLFLGYSMPLRSDVIVTNVNQLQLGGLALFLWGQARTDWRLRNLFSGVVLGLLLAFKPNLGLCAAFLFLTWAVNQRWRKLGEHVLGLIFGFTAAIVCSIWAFGSTDCWQEWLASLRELLVDVASSSELGNYALANMIEETAGIRLSKALLVILAATAFAVVVRARRRTSDDDSRDLLHEDMLAISLGVTAMFLSSVLVWLHYYILLIPTALYCLRPAEGACRRSRNDYWSMVAAWLGAVLLLPFRPVTGVALRAMDTLSVPEPVAKTVLFSFGTALFFVLVLREFWSLKTETEPASVEIPGALAGVR
jgi:hypothetical protein